MGAPALATVTFAGEADGIAAVASLLRAAVVRRWGACQAIAMFDGPARPPRAGDKVRFGARLARVAILSRPPWLFVNHLGLLKALAPLPATVRPPYAVFLHGIEAWKVLPPADSAWVAHARVRLANSKYTAARVLAANPGVGPIVTCPLALESDQVPFTGGRRLGSMQVLVVGRVSSTERYKGHDELLDVWPAVRAAVPAARLIFAGGGDDVERLRTRASDPALEGSVQVLGFVPDAQLAQLYDESACFALPSRGEGFGLVYLEAMARGLPCLALRDSAAADIVVDGGTGLLVRHGDPRALAEGLIALLEDCGRRQAWGRAGRARVVAEFSRQAFEQRVVAALEAAFETPIEAAS
jgi:phosphatidylinositol alpha-1,6-mannosyltransferase